MRLVIIGASFVYGFITRKKRSALIEDEKDDSHIQDIKHDADEPDYSFQNK